MVDFVVNQMFMYASMMNINFVYMPIDIFESFRCYFVRNNYIFATEMVKGDDHIGEC